jgi:hypothetical protein
MKYVITFLLTLTYLISVSQVFPTPGEYPDLVDDNSFTILKGWHNPYVIPLPIDYKYNAVNRRLTFKAKFSTSCWGTESADSAGWSKLGRIFHFKSTDWNEYKLHFGWRSDMPNEGMLKISCFFHESDYSSGKTPWVSHRFSSVVTNEVQDFDMYLVSGTKRLSI